jgi:membrane fusion protein (multidrug efflux system)
VNFDVPQQATDQMRGGRDVRVTTGEGAGASFHGRITAVDSVVNPETRNIQVQATLANPEGALRPGMFVQTEVVLGARRRVIALPATAISHAPYGDSVFVVASLKGPNGETYRGVRQQFVTLEGARGDQVGVIAGVKPGDEIATSGVFKLRNGAALLVNNTVQPGNDPAPTPLDN